MPPTSDKLGITGKDAAALDDALQDCVDHSLSLSLNAACSAAITDEAAASYSIDLSTGDQGQDRCRIGLGFAR